MNLKYKIEFHTDWHCGSGLAAGADVDALVVKDQNGMPFIPGKTIKGLMKEAVEEIRFFKKDGENASLSDAFGFFDDKDEKRKGILFFTNAVLGEEEYNAIMAAQASRFLYRKISSTAIDVNGIAKEHSLRKMETVVPCTLYGTIYDVPENLIQEIVEAMEFIKRLGQNRNRGLGRCTMSKINEEGRQA